MQDIQKVEREDGQSVQIAEHKQSANSKGVRELERTVENSKWLVIHVSNKIKRLILLAFWNS